MIGLGRPPLRPRRRPPVREPALQRDPRVSRVRRVDPDTGDPVKRQEGLALATEKLERAYAWLEGRLAGKTWAAGMDFTLADCAAAPSLFYADWTHRISETFPVLRAYRARLLNRPSFARAVEEARPFRPLFPLGAPDRD